MRIAHLLAVAAGLAIIGLCSVEASAMYHPTLGRWAQRDPALRDSAEDGVVSLAGAKVLDSSGSTRDYVDGANLYQYGRACPVGVVDPSGLIVIGAGGWMGKGVREINRAMDSLAAGINSDDNVKKRIRGGKGESVSMVEGHEGKGEAAMLRLLREYRDRKDEGWLWGLAGCWEEEVVLVGYSDGATMIWRMFNQGKIQNALRSRYGPQYSVAFVGFVDLVRTGFTGPEATSGLSKPGRLLNLDDGQTILRGNNVFQQDPGGWKGTVDFNHSRFENIPVDGASHAGRWFSGRPPVSVSHAVQVTVPENAIDAYKAALARSWLFSFRGLMLLQ